MRPSILILACAMPWLPMNAVGAEPLRSIANMRELPAEQLAQHPEVEVECIVLSVLQGGGQKMVVWQDGVGMFVNATWSDDQARRILPRHNISPGDRLRIKGTVAEGQIAPVIVPDKIEWLKSGSMPEARPANLVEMLSGRLASQWVRVDGVIQSVKPDSTQNKYWMLEIGTPHGNFVARMTRKPGVDPTVWIDAAVSARGICLHIFNRRSEVIGVRMHINGAADITVIKESPKDPFSVAATPLTRLQPFTPHEIMPHRRKISGIVTLCRPGDFLYLQDEGRAVKIRTPDTTAFQPGDRVEAAGFITRVSHVAEIHHAVLRKVGTTTPPEPLEVLGRWPDLLRTALDPPPHEDLNGRLIELTGVLELEGDDLEGHWLSVVHDGSAAIVRVPAGMRDIPRRGSVIRLTGICELEYPVNDLVETFTLPTGIRLLMRDATDLTVIKSPSWWTPRRLWMVVAAMAALLLLSLAWVRTLNRKVRQRGMALANEISGRQLAEARTEERTRMAEELHDTLAQGLTGVSLQLEAAGRAWEERPEKLPHHLRLADQILSSSRDEVRRSLWNLRSGLLDTGDLIGSLQAIAANLSPEMKPEISCRCEGTVKDLPDSVAHTLLRIAQEALSNAVNHASAQHVEAVVEFGETDVTLVVRDDGRGFDLKDAMGMSPTHFGLQGMRGRMRRLNGQFEIDSKPGGGTTVRAVIPFTARPGQTQPPS